MTARVTDLAALSERPHAHVFPGDEPRTVRLALEAGEAVPSHSHPGRTVVCHVLTGELAVALGDESVTLSAGEVARFDGDQEIAPRGVEDTEALLVLAKTA